MPAHQTTAQGLPRAVLYNADMLMDMPRPIVIAHRGACAHAPENSMAAFELAAKAGAAAIELDVRLSADEEVLVFHDVSLGRCTGASGRVGEKTAAQLRQFRIRDASASSYEEAPIPFLDEVLGAFEKTLCFNVHIKDAGRKQQQLIERTCELIRRHGLEGRTLFSSFQPADLAQAAKRLPGVARALLAARGWLGAWSRSFGFSFGEYAALHPNQADVTSQQIQRVHRLGRRVHAWTVNNPMDVARLAAWGVDGILTDDPGMAVRALGRTA